VVASCNRWLTNCGYINISAIENRRPLAEQRQSKDTLTSTLPLHWQDRCPGRPQRRETRLREVLHRDAQVPFRCFLFHFPILQLRVTSALLAGVASHRSVLEPGVRHRRDRWDHV